MLEPSRRTSPLCQCLETLSFMRFRERRNVVLPDPVGPDQSRDGALGDRDVDVRQHCGGAEAERQFFCLHGGRRRRLVHVNDAGVLLRCSSRVSSTNSCGGSAGLAIRRASHNVATLGGPIERKMNGR